MIYSKEDTQWVCRDWMYDLEKVAGDGVNMIKHFEWNSRLTNKIKRELFFMLYHINHTGSISTTSGKTSSH